MAESKAKRKEKRKFRRDAKDMLKEERRLRGEDVENEDHFKEEL
jgi:hypothetical protein